MLVILKVLAYANDHGYNKKKHADDINALLSLDKYKNSTDVFIKKEQAFLNKFVNLDIFKAMLKEAVVFSEYASNDFRKGWLRD
ncbi:MAG: hypothetical protein M1360_04590 [Candidatus Marsarchaeota archaeon]|jgi:hypothetical protein|nr:hypothetical protein [Candidatus Marsarchaeota archaeon]MCL5419184.1 hypothetical protein [Candidatus Marsarchaeota archaeon]